MNRRLIAPLSVAVALSMLALTGCQATTATPGSSSSSSGSAAASGDVLPVATNPIVNASTAPGLSIVSAKAEDNVDPATKAAVADRLQITLRNDTTKALTGFEVFYTMTDTTTKQKESYYQDLGSFSIAAGAETTISFDGDSGAGHFPENKYSLYRSSTNKVDFTIEVSAAGVKPAQGTATKGAGTGEVVGG